MADGSYGEVSLAASKASAVTLEAEHPGQATINGASLDGSHLTLARFDVSDEIVVQPGSSGMTIEHNRISGGWFGIDACASTTTTCDDERIVGNRIVGPFGEDGIRANRYHDADGDGVGLLVEGNELTGIRENGSHSDCIQTVWVGDHLVFRRNYLHDNRCQGFFVKDQAAAIDGIDFEDNLLVRDKEPCGPPLSSCGQPNYVNVYGPYADFTMRRNTIWQDEVTTALRPSPGPNTAIDSNVVSQFWTDADFSAAGFADNTLCRLETGSGGSWPASQPGKTVDCNPPFPNPSADDYRLGNGRGVDWAPAEQHYGP